ncbi:RNA polymerase sigma factor [Actinophytocola glycyrrhizae]|uniref:RNA polymerase sigma factor n=1 Tax=Actinophytocola glycyrrhizae TaxID=2044873 RepID=A0ABV9S7V7_9PSEU
MTAGQTAADLSAAVRAARGGNEAAFRLLYREVQPGLLRYLRGLVGGEDAEDLASETWLQIARDIRTFRDDGAGGFRGWAATIARHRALDHVRRAQRRPVAGLSADVLVDLPDRNDTAEQAITQAATNATVELIATLPRDQAEAVLLRVVLGLDAQAVAAVMGKRPGAVRTAVWRGLRKLAERLDQTGDRRVTTTGVTRTGKATPRKSS